MRLIWCGIGLVGMGCLAEEIGSGSGSITVSNRDAVDYAIVISDTPDCIIGLKGSLEDNTQRMFGVAENSYFCLQKGGAGVSVVNGGVYEVKGGVFRTK